MDHKEFLIKLQALLQEDEALTENMVLKNIETWDSMSIIETVALIDSELGVSISFEEVEESVTVKDLLARIEG